MARSSTSRSEDIRSALRADPGQLSPIEIATAARAPLTLLGTLLRATQAEESLSAAQSLVLSQLTAVESMAISELAAGEGGAISTMTEIVNRLENAGLVTKERAEADRRQVRVSITATGRRSLTKNLRLREKVLAMRIERLSPEDRAALAAALPALWNLAGIDPEIWPQLPRTSP